jgi:hypothetical protein
MSKSPTVAMALVARISASLGPIPSTCWTACGGFKHGGGPARLVRTSPSPLHLSAPQIDIRLVAIAGNLNRKYPYATYFCCAGLEVSQGDGYEVAVGFTSSFNALVTKVEVAVGYFGSGVNAMVLSLNNDANGQPGSVIMTWNLMNLPQDGTCCALSVVNDGAVYP